MRTKATLETKIVPQLHTYVGTSNITSFNLVTEDTGIEKLYTALGIAGINLGDCCMHNSILYLFHIKA